MKNMNEVSKKIQNNCTGCVSGAMLGGLGAFILSGLVFTLGAITIPITATVAVVRGTIGKHIDKKNK